MWLYRVVYWVADWSKRSRVIEAQSAHEARLLAAQEDPDFVATPHSPRRLRRAA